MRKPSKEALALWQALPAETRRMILGNIWCGQCSKVVTLSDYSVELHGEVVLKGFCGVCGHKVARVVEGCVPAVKKVKAPAAGLYVFDVWLYEDEHHTDGQKITRKIQISGSKSLYTFAKVIIDAFSFKFDHCFGFYDNLKDKKNCRKAFELFIDMGERSTRPMAKGVKKTKISQAFDVVGEKLVFLFDYGDYWQFNVELKEIRKADKGDLKPVILESTGKAPLQYPPWEEEE